MLNIEHIQSMHHLPPLLDDHSFDQWIWWLPQRTWGVSFQDDQWCLINAQQTCVDVYDDQEEAFGALSEQATLEYVLTLEARGHGSIALRAYQLLRDETSAQDTRELYEDVRFVHREDGLWHQQRSDEGGLNTYQMVAILQHAKTQSMHHFTVACYINQYLYPEMSTYIDDAMCFQLWLDCKRRRVNENTIAEMVEQIHFNIHHQRTHLSSLEQWHDEDAAMSDMLGRIGNLSEAMLDEGVYHWFKTNRDRLIDALQAYFVDYWDGDFDALTDAQRVGEIRASLAEAKRTQAVGYAQDIARAWTIAQQIHMPDLRQSIRTQYLQPWFDE